MSETIQEINQKVKNNHVKVVTAEEMTRLVRESGPKKAAEKVDVVTTGTFGAMCSSGAWLSLGHSDPPIKIARRWLNDVQGLMAVVGGTVGMWGDLPEMCPADVEHDLITRG